jgi:hypothetical protein
MTIIKFRPTFSGLSLAGAGALLASFLTPAPNGTRPTKLTASVVAVGANQMRAQGRYTLADGVTGIAGMPIKVYSCGVASFALWTTTYTDNSGNYSVTTAKVPTGMRVQIEAEGNGAYSRPYPTFPRP